MAFIANVYEGDGVGVTLIASATPSDGIFDNVLIGSRGADTLYGENTNGVSNEMHGLRGNDVMYGGVGTSQLNIYVGGAGIDTAMIPLPHNVVQVAVDYQGGVHLLRPDGGEDHINSETEIVLFSNGERLLTISGGVDDLAFTTTQIYWHSGDTLAISQDWLIALNSGLISIGVQDFNHDGVLDTVLQGYNGVNTYALLDYNMYQHPNFIVGQFGDGLLLDLA